MKRSTPPLLQAHLLSSNIHLPTDLTRAATKIQASFRGHQVRRDDILQRKEADLCRQMEQLHTRRRPQTATEDGTGEQRRRQNTGDGGKLAMEGPLGRVDPLSKMKTSRYSPTLFSKEPSQALAGLS